MALLQRVGRLISQDLGALLPGTGIALDRAAMLRLFLYLCVFILTVRLFLPVLTGSRGSDVQHRPAPQVQPEIRGGGSGSSPTLDVQEI